MRALRFIVVALLWTYFGWLILLAGAQLSFYIQNPMYLRLGTQELRLSCVELEQLALKMMYLVGQMHLTGGKRWTINRLARQLQLPGNRSGEDGRALEAAGSSRYHDDSSCYAPATSAGSQSMRSWTWRATSAADTFRRETCHSRRWTG